MLCGRLSYWSSVIEMLLDCVPHECFHISQQMFWILGGIFMGWNLLAAVFLWWRVGK